MRNTVLIYHAADKNIFYLISLSDDYSSVALVAANIGAYHFRKTEKAVYES